MAASWPRDDGDMAIARKNPSVGANGTDVAVFVPTALQAVRSSNGCPGAKAWVLVTAWVLQ